MKRTAPTELRSCTNLECGASGLRTETCPRCGAPTFSDPNAREDPETARRRRESLEAVSPELLSQLREIKEQTEEKEQVSGRYVTILLGLVAAAVVLLIGGFVIARSRDDGGGERGLEVAAEELLDDVRAGDAAGVCDRMTTGAQARASALGGGTCTIAVGGLLPTAQPTVAGATITDVTVTNQTGVAGLQTPTGVQQLTFVREGGSWRLTSPDVFLALGGPAVPPPQASQPPAQPAPGAATPTPGGATAPPGPEGSTTTPDGTSTDPTPPPTETAPGILEGGQQP